LLLHNVAAAARALTLTASYHVNGLSTSVILGSLTLAAGATHEFDFASLLSNLSAVPDDSVVNITTSFSGRDGDVRMEGGSVDQSGNYVFEAESQVEGTTISRIICYWTVTGDTNTMISLWNYSDASQDLVLTLYYQGGRELDARSLQHQSPSHCSSSCSMYHVNAWGLPYSAVMNGSKLVLPGRNLHPPALLDLMQEEQVTLAAGVPTIWMGILDALGEEPDRWNLASELRVLIGDAAAPESMFRRFDKFGIQAIRA
jgi:acyl-CoA synthetase (AMP-forming)/AMP-acid ligase II